MNSFVQKLLRCFFRRSAKVSPAPFCPDLHYACRFTHFNCMKELLLKDKQDRKEDRRQSYAYFDSLAIHGTFEMILFLLDNGYHPRWSSFYGLLVAYRRMEILQELYENHFSWNLDYINDRHFILNVKERSSSKGDFASTLLYFINYADISPTIFTIVPRGFTEIIDLLRPCIDKIRPDELEKYDQARNVIRQLLHIKAVLFFIDKENIKIIEGGSYTAAGDIRKGSWCMAEDYPAFSAAFSLLQTRKQEVLRTVMELDLVPKDVVKYIIGLYILS